MMKWLLSLAALMVLAGAALLAFSWLILAPDLPTLEAVTDYKPKIPLRVYTSDNVLIGEFGEEHRDFVPIKEIPGILKHALLSIEDARFYEHGGIDFIGLTRAVLSDITGGVKQGASTITMQVARNFFLTREKTLSRKLKEIMLSYRIENALSKDQILELYMNQIYLGQRTHGFSSAARTYFGKSLKELSIAEAAMLAGIPQNPARHNPAVNPQRAKARQILVLKSMSRLGYITEGQYEMASKEQLKVSGSLQFETHAPYVAEMVRQSIYAQYKDNAYTMGIKVYTTINRVEQEAAYESLRRNVIAYDQRHGFRGPEAFIELPRDEDARDEAIDQLLLKHPASDLLLPAVVKEVNAKLVKAELANGETIQIFGDGLRFASAGLLPKAGHNLKLVPGALIRVMQDNNKANNSANKERWKITQLPDVDAAYVSLNAQDGSYRALVGGFDFNRKEFNHVTSAWRQPGSAMKPFIYSAALEKGFFAGTMINDAPLSATSSEPVSWDPRNDDNKYEGPVSMQKGLAQSKNVVAVRILKAIGPAYARDYLPRFGFDASKHPLDLTMVLGTGSVTPVQLAGAYAVFANGGYQVTPWLIQKVTDDRGRLMFEATPPATDREKTRVIDARNAYIMDGMLREVTRSGTGAMASQKLGRHDLAGKTGTTSGAVDGWFAGYASNIVAVAWMGCDDPKSLGGREFGSTLALPIWIDTMRQSLAGKPESSPAIPANMASVDGYWSYSEYQTAGSNAVKNVDIEAPPFWQFWK